MPSLPDLRRSRRLEPSTNLSSQQSALKVKQGCVKPPQITQNVPFMRAGRTWAPILRSLRTAQWARG